MRRPHLILSAALLALPLTAGAQSNHVVTVIDNPGGGTIFHLTLRTASPEDFGNAP